LGKTRFLTCNSEIKEIYNLGDNGTLFDFIREPKFVVDNVEIAPRLIYISKQEITADEFLIIVPLKKQFNKEIR
jgi:hypothetical protein